MSMTVVLLKIDEERIVQALQETMDKLDSVEDEVVLDFTSVRRIGPSALRRDGRLCEHGRKQGRQGRIVRR